MEQSEFCEHISQYKKPLYITAYSILENEADAEDAVCNAILNGYEHLSQLKNPLKFKAWMISITKNEALKIRQKRLELPGNAKQPHRHAHLPMCRPQPGCKIHCSVPA